MIAKGRLLALALAGLAVAGMAHASAHASAQGPAPQPGTQPSASQPSAPQPSAQPSSPPSSAPAETPEQAQDRHMVETTCAACHPIVQVTARRMAPEDWAATVDKMIGMGAQVASEQDRDRIIAWLATHQGPQ